MVVVVGNVSAGIPFTASSPNGAPALEAANSAIRVPTCLFVEMRTGDVYFCEGFTSSVVYVVHAAEFFAFRPSLAAMVAGSRDVWVKDFADTFTDSDHFRAGAPAVGTYLDSASAECVHPETGLVYFSGYFKVS